jgi:hypothetical protein
MRGGLVAAIGHAYRDPRDAMARQIADGLSEPRALAHLTLACALGFVASLPGAVRIAPRLDAPDALAGAVAAHLFAYLAVAPLLLYGVAAVVHLVARGFGGRGGFLGARAAVFWALLLAGPMALAFAYARAIAESTGAVGVLPWLDYLVYAGAAYWLWLLAASLAEAEAFPATRPVAAVILVVFAAVAIGVGTLSDAAPASG